MSRLRGNTPENRVDFQLWSTTVTLVVTEARRSPAARAELDAELAAVEAACSRFRADSEISMLLRKPIVDAQLSPVLNEAISAAFRAAARIAARTGGGVLVSLGGDIAVAGSAPVGGWRVAIGDDHRTAETAPDTMVAISGGGLATSSITARSWPTAGGARHHLIDPRTGENPPPWWRTVSVAAGSALAANAAATAAVILGEQVAHWLTTRRLPARLVRVDGSAVTTVGWPDQEEQAA